MTRVMIPQSPQRFTRLHIPDTDLGIVASRNDDIRHGVNRNGSDQDVMSRYSPSQLTSGRVIGFDLASTIAGYYTVLLRISCRQRIDLTFQAIQAIPRPSTPPRRISSPVVISQMIQ